MNDILGNIQFDLFWSLSLDIYEEVKLQTFNTNFSMQVGSARYWSELALNNERYVKSGIYKEAFAKALTDYGISPDGANGSSFDEIVDKLYDDYHLEDGFFYAFDNIYNDTYNLVIEHAYLIDRTSDITAIATDYMR